jgi:hypothetical protein
MAQNGQYYHQPYNHNPQAPPPPPRGQYHAQQPTQYAPQHDLRRASSFDAGDDATLGMPVEEDQGVAYDSSQPARANGPYRGGTVSRQRDDELFLADQPQIPPRQTRQEYSQRQGLAGYQHQYQPASSPGQSSQPSYNPQEFAFTQSQPPPPTPPTTNQFAGLRHSVSHHPYNPAAYRSPGLQYQAGQPSPRFPLNGYSVSGRPAASPPTGPLPQLPQQGYFDRPQSHLGTANAMHSTSAYAANAPPPPPPPSHPAHPPQPSG